jgi:hypothetical protein
MEVQHFSSAESAKKIIERGLRTRNRAKAGLKSVMRNHGLMEWVSVPWTNHKTADNDAFNDLTVNFSLWVLHILAGNKHEITWSPYSYLGNETLVRRPCLPLSIVEPRMESAAASESRDIVHHQGTVSNKREAPSNVVIATASRVHSELEEDVAASFAKEDEFSLTQVRLLQPSRLLLSCH